MKKMLAVTALVLILVVALAAFTPGSNISWNSGYAAWSGGYASWSSGSPIGLNIYGTDSVNWGGGGGGGGGGG